MEVAYPLAGMSVDPVVTFMRAGCVQACTRHVRFILSYLYIP